MLLLASLRYSWCMRVKTIRQAMLVKQAEQTGDDERQHVSGEQQTYPDPAGHVPSMTSSTDLHGSAVVHEAASGRMEFLNRIFDNVGSAATADKAVISQYFDTPASERRPSHSALLQKKASVHVRDSLTLKQRVRSTLG